MFDVRSFDVEKFDGILSRGLSNGLGKRDGQMCIEAAICATLGLEHQDDPGCVAKSVRSFKIRLNDSSWSSPAARAEGLRDLGLAQLGSLGVVNDKEFATRMAEKTIRILIPKLFRHIFSGNEVLLKAAARCEVEGSLEAIRDARKHAACAAYAAYAAYAADAACAADAADAAYAAYAAYAKRGSKDDAYLILSASLALETLRELKSPGCELLAEMESAS